MKKCIFIALFLFIKTLVFSQTASNQEQKPAKFYIIGVIHSAKEYRNVDSLLVILKKINPDLILAETDTLSYFNKDYSLVNPPNWYLTGLKLNLVTKMPPEMDVLYRYRAYTSLVAIHPFDITIPNRKKYTEESIKNQMKWAKDLNLMSSNNELPKELKIYHDNYLKYNNWHFQTYQMGYFKMNQKVIVDSIKQMLEFENMYVPKLIESVPRLNGYQNWQKENTTYWKLRNETMSKNILKFIKLKNAKTIVIFTGLMHKYYLVDLLNAVKKEHNLELHEFYESNLQ